MSIKWNPQKSTIFLIKEGVDRNKALNVFRNSSSAYISKMEVKLILHTKYSGICNLCGGKDSIEIDHKKSVYNCFKDADFEFCNSIDNLQLLCKSCNIKKSHNNG